MTILEEIDGLIAELERIRWTAEIYELEDETIRRIEEAFDLICE